MKRSGTTLIFVIVWTAVLFASFVIGICIREVRFQYAKVESKADTEPDVSSEVQRPDATDQLVSELAQRKPIAAGSGGSQRGPSPEDRAGFGGDRMAGMRERFEGMSEEERQEAIAQMRERFGGRRREGGMGGRFGGGRREGGMGGMGGRFENMSEEERQEAIAQMRERFGGGRREGGMGERFGGGRQEGGMGGMGGMSGRFENMSEEEREEFRAQMRERFSGRRSGGRRQEND